MELPHLPALCVSETDFRAEAKGFGRLSFLTVCAASMPGSPGGPGSLTLRTLLWTVLVCHPVFQ